MGVYSEVSEPAPSEPESFNRGFFCSIMAHQQYIQDSYFSSTTRPQTILQKWVVTTFLRSKYKKCGICHRIQYAEISISEFCF